MNYLLSFKACVSCNIRIQTSLHGLCMALQRSFAPTYIPAVVNDFDKEPARRDTEIFDSSNFPHDLESRFLLIMASKNEHSTEAEFLCYFTKSRALRWITGYVYSYLGSEWPSLSAFDNLRLRKDVVSLCIRVWRLLIRETLNCKEQLPDTCAIGYECGTGYKPPTTLEICRGIGLGGC